jgi:hypothetical protein
MNKPALICLVTLSAVGVLSIGYSGLKYFAHKLFPGYEAYARAEFDSPERIKEIITLYEHVKAAGFDSTELEAQKYFGVPHYDFSTVKKIPEEWVPQVFRDEIRQWGSADDVVAYYNEENELQGVEFFGSRYGCLISESPTVCTAWFDSLHRIYEKKTKSESYYITIIDRGSD